MRPPSLLCSSFLLLAACSATPDVTPIPAPPAERPKDDSWTQPMWWDRAFHAFAFATGGSRVVTAGNQVDVWDAASRVRLQTWSAEGLAPGSLSISPDGERVALVSWNGIAIWDVQSGGRILRAEHPEKLKARAQGTFSGGGWSADGAYVAAIWSWHMDDCGGGGVAVFRADSGAFLWSREGQIRQALFAPSLFVLARAEDHFDLFGPADDSWVRTEYDPMTGAERGRVELFKGRDITHAVLSPDGTVIASAARGGGIRVAPVLRPEADRMVGGPEEVWSLSFSSDGRNLLIDYRDTFELVPLVDEAPALMQKWTRHDHGRDAILSPDRRQVAFLQSGGVRLVEVASGRAEYIGGCHWSSAYGVALDPSRRRAVSSGADSSLVWDLGSGHAVAALPPSYGCSLSADGRWMVLLDLSGSIDLWDAGSLKKLRSYPKGHLPWTRAWFSPEGGELAAATAAEMILWETEGGAELRRFTFPSQTNDIDISPDWRWIAAGPWQKFTLWERATGRGVAAYWWPDWQPVRIAFSPDSQLIVTGCCTNGITVEELRVFRADSGDVVGRTPLGRLVMNQITFTEDPDYAMVAGTNGRGGPGVIVRIHLPSGRTDLILEAPGDHFTSWAIEPRGSKLIATTTNGRVLISRLP